MNPVVIDTNVLLVANGAHKGASLECILECTQKLQSAMQSNSIAIDDAGRIIKEYQKKTSPNQPNGPGDVFLKWLIRNRYNAGRVDIIPITETKTNEFSEFPNASLQAVFDPSDRKFVAVSAAHPNQPPIWQAVDCKWLAWWQQLMHHGVEVKFLCPNDICKFYKKKFPKKLLPPLPQV